jgi:hypothetical protein
MPYEFVKLKNNKPRDWTCPRFEQDQGSWCKAHCAGRFSALTEHVWPSACLTQGGPVPAAGTRGSPSFMSSLGGEEWARSRGPTCSQQRGAVSGRLLVRYGPRCQGDGPMAGPTPACVRLARRRRADERPRGTGTCTCDAPGPGPNWTGPPFSAFAMHAHHSNQWSCYVIRELWSLKECGRFSCEVAVST